MTGLVLSPDPVQAQAQASQVKLGSTEFYPPFSFRDDQGRPAGFDIELFREIARENAWEPSFSFDNWTLVQQQLRDGEVDAVAMFVSESRSQLYLFSAPINVEYHLLFGLQDSPSHNTLQTLAGSRVATENSAYALDQLRQLDIDIELVEAGSEAEALRMAQRGEVDYALIPSQIARYTINAENLDSLAALSPPLLPVTYAFALNPQREDLLQAINQSIISLQRQGIMEELRERWLVIESPDSFMENLFDSLWITLPLLLLSLLGITLSWMYRSRLGHMSLAMNNRERMLRSVQKRIKELGRRDPLTGLISRDHFLDLLDKALVKAGQQQQNLAVGIYAMRDIEYIQHALGEQIADDLIRQQAEILKKAYPGICAYTNPGRFLFLMEAPANREKATERMQHLGSLLACNLKSGDMLVEIQLNGGLVYTEKAEQSGMELLRRAKLALIHAQNRGSELLLYNPSMEPDPHNLTLMSDLRNALQENSLQWLFQPQYDVGSASITGAEMLIRWHHAQHGWVPPDKFIVLAEQSGLIKPITRGLILQAVQILQGWQVRGLRRKLSINVSAHDLADVGMISFMCKHLEDFSAQVTLELTETALLQDVKTIINNVSQLKRSGIGISLDDYGTGYSSLEYLKDLNFDEIKIDKMFVQNIHDSPKNMKLIEASIQLGHDLGAVIVAEGVENAETASLLIAAGCDILQGYGISRPLSIEGFDEFAASYQAFEHPPHQAFRHKTH